MGLDCIPGREQPEADGHDPSVIMNGQCVGLFH